MRRILFVDDEPVVLETLQEILANQRHQWEMSFRSSGEAALKELESAPFDVIIADMKMPGMDGSALLTQVRDRFPNIVRMILTGYSSLETTLRAVPVAHQFLIKPCDPGMIRVAVERACQLKALLGSELIRRTVGATQQLPPVPRIYAALTLALADRDVSLDHVAKIIEQDVAISARILQLVNSPLFGLARHVSTIRTAVSYMGVEVVKNLALSVETFLAFHDSVKIAGFLPEDLNTHAFLTARIAAKLPTEAYLKDAAHVAALLHDVGKLVMMAKLPDHFKRVIAGIKEENRPMHAIEEQLIGVTHAEIGAYLLGLWGLPYAIVEAVAYHHAPAKVPNRSFDPLAAVHIANILAHEVRPTMVDGAAIPYGEPDSGYLEALGVAARLPSWRGMAEEVADAAVKA